MTIMIYGFPFPTLAFPVVGMVSIALGCATYSMARDLHTNPDVRITKSHRQDELDELPVCLERAQGYVKKGAWSSFYAKIGGAYNTSAKSTFVTYGRD